jgi:hypothetical protein
MHELGISPRPANLSKKLVPPQRTNSVPKMPSSFVIIDINPKYIKTTEYTILKMNFVKAFYKKAEVKIINTLFSLFWFYNYLFVLAEEKLTRYGFLKKYFVSTNQLVEPNLDTWNCVTSVTPQFKLVEQYKYGSEEEPVLKEGALFIRKCDTYRLSFISNEVRVEPSPNATRFLNIMYFHKGMSDPIKIVLDPAYIRNGNEVFSKTFVYRMLCYQYNPGDYVFDDTYELHFMDDKIRKRVLKSKEHIVFGNGGYEVVNEVLSLVLPENEVLDDVVPDLVKDDEDLVEVEDDDEDDLVEDDEDDEDDDDLVEVEDDLDEDDLHRKLN